MQVTEYTRNRLAHHILCNATVFGVSLLVPLLSRIVLQHLAIKNDICQGKNIYCWEFIIIEWNILFHLGDGRDLQRSASAAARFFCCIAQVLLIQRLPVSCHIPGVWLGMGDVGAFQYFVGSLCYSYHSRSSASRADPVVRELFCSSTDQTG